jgi:hypothetical protein
VNLVSTSDEERSDEDAAQDIEIVQIQGWKFIYLFFNIHMTQLLDSTSSSNIL